MQRGTANTRWRDFVDINALLTAGGFDNAELNTAIQRVAEHRQTTIRPLAETLSGYPELAQARWRAWRRNQRLETTTPDRFSSLLEAIVTSIDRLLAQETDR